MEVCGKRGSNETHFWTESQDISSQKVKRELEEPFRTFTLEHNSAVTSLIFHTDTNEEETETGDTTS